MLWRLRLVDGLQLPQLELCQLHPDAPLDVRLVVNLQRVILSDRLDVGLDLLEAPWRCKETLRHTLRFLFFDTDRDLLGNRRVCEVEVIWHPELVVAEEGAKGLHSFIMLILSNLLVTLSYPLLSHLRE